MKNIDFSVLEKKIGYKFKDINWLICAMTHTSYAHEQSDHGRIINSNERLEFLGDSVLSLIVTNYLFDNFSQIHEGDMTDIRKYTVDTEALSSYARSIDLGEFLLLGKGEELTNGRQKNKLLENAFEALIAAIYKDGSIEDVKKFLSPFFKDRIETFFTIDNTDPKTALQQIIQLTPGEHLEYVLISESDPAHNKTFTVEARLNSNVIGTGSARSKREAEKQAAIMALKYFEN